MGIIDIVNILVAVLLIGGLLFFVNKCLIRRALTPEVHKISFKESIDLAELPIITFTSKNIKVNFLLDSGSNYSHICSKIAKRLKVKQIDADIPVAGIGNSSSNKVCNIVLNYKDREYEDTFCVTPSLDETFKGIKDECGVTVHGILGNGFFQRYKYVLDFDELVAYEKKK